MRVHGLSIATTRVPVCRNGRCQVVHPNPIRGFYPVYAKARPGPCHATPSRSDDIGSRLSCPQRRLAMSMMATATLSARLTSSARIAPRRRRPSTPPTSPCAAVSRSRSPSLRSVATWGLRACHRLRSGCCGNRLAARCFVFVFFVWLFALFFFEKWCCSLRLVSRCFVLPCFRGRNRRGGGGGKGEGGGGGGRREWEAEEKRA